MIVQPVLKGGSLKNTLKISVTATNDLDIPRDLLIRLHDTIIKHGGITYSKTDNDMDDLSIRLMSFIVGLNVPAPVKIGAYIIKEQDSAQILFFLDAKDLLDGDNGKNTELVFLFDRIVVSPKFSIGKPA